MFALASISTHELDFWLPTAASSRGRSETCLRALFAVIFLSACVNGGLAGPAPTAATGADVVQGSPSEIEVRVGQTVRVAMVAITFVGVSDDSRCPTGVTCVWEGDAIVRLRVGRDGATDEPVSLHANPRFSQEAVAAGVRLRLVRLEPYPDADRPIAPGEYRAALAVTVD